MSVISPSSLTSNKRNYISLPDSLVIVDASHRSAFSDKLTLSSAQMYLEHPGSIIGISPLMKYGKVISIDDHGCIVIWNVNHDRLIRLQQSTNESTSPNTHEYINNNDSINENNNSINLNNSRRQIEETRGLTGDFESAVSEDSIVVSENLNQAMWSKNYPPDPVDGTYLSIHLKIEFFFLLKFKNIIYINY
jgi:hypothetical protein